MCVAVTVQENRESYLPYCSHPHVRAYPPILTVLWFVSRVTAHHSKFLHGDSKVHRLRDCFDEFQAPLHPAAHTGHSLVHSILRLQYEIRILQVISTVKPWQRDFVLVSFLAGYSFLYCNTGLVHLKKEARAKLRYESIQ